jgi:hypothetical protein
MEALVVEPLEMTVDTSSPVFTASFLLTKEELGAQLPRLNSR